MYLSDCVTLLSLSSPSFNLSCNISTCFCNCSSDPILLGRGEREGLGQGGGEERGGEGGEERGGEGG